MATMGKLSNQPLFNIRSVAARTGIAPETLRAWERRYGFPDPFRNPKGYRLYTEDEIAALRWLKDQTEAGMNIRQAIQLLAELRAHGQDPVDTGGVIAALPTGQHRPVTVVQADLLEALLRLDEESASLALRETFARNPLEVALLDVISPTMVAIGDRWHSGEIPVAVEHFASQLCRQFLIRAMRQDAVSGSKGHVVAACAPGEFHELGLLMVVLLLRDRAIDVTYLGPDLSLERLHEALAPIRPQMILFSATSPQSAQALVDLVQILDAVPAPKPLIGLGGLAFQTDPTLTNRIPGTYFGPTGVDAVHQIERVLTHLPKAARQDPPTNRL